ncbi:cytochrome-c peroxidase [Magnetococcus sp. PR-3]|uniref:cytochrome-c peroxidase n=1 Tax=Magnetococcus sp. PR-3 TaxID=3120355 RepID=UPI003FA5A8C0
MVPFFVQVPTAWAEYPAPFKINNARAELGKRLFFDRRLSGDATLACSDCHIPKHGFSDARPLARAYTGMDGFRNAPTLINSAYRAAWFHDGRIGTNLNDVTREMITESWTMNMDMRLMQERVKQDPLYVTMFQAAGLGEPSNGGVRKAIPEYLKTLISKPAPVDQGTLSPAAQRGQALFQGKAGCQQCHSGPRYSDDQPHNLGVPENPSIFNTVKRHVTYVTFAKFMGVANPMGLRRDIGAHVRTHRADQRDMGSFMTPTLRALVYTAPYMHNGTLPTLEAVVAFYNAGGGVDPHKDPRLKPLGLTQTEQKDLVAFLKALSGPPLTGEAYVWDKPFPVEYEAIENWQEVEN